MTSTPSSRQLDMTALKLPGPLLTVFPNFCDTIPLMKEALKDVSVKEISKNFITATLPLAKKEAYESLSLEAPKAALNARLAQLLEVDQAIFELYLRDPEVINPPPTQPQIPEPTPQTPPARNAKTHNKLTTVQQIALTDWLRANEAAARKESDPKLAELASVALEFTVTPPNLTSIRTALGFEKTKPDTPPTIEEQLAEAKHWFFKLAALVKHNFEQGTLSYPKGWPDIEGYDETIKKFLNPAS